MIRNLATMGRIEQTQYLLDDARRALGRGAGAMVSRRRPQVEPARSAVGAPRYRHR